MAAAAAAVGVSAAVDVAAPVLDAAAVDGDVVVLLEGGEGGM